MAGYEFFVPIKPIGKGRPRVTRGGMHTYTPAKTKRAEKEIQAIALSKGVRPLDGAIEMLIHAEFQPPKSWSKKALNALDNGTIYRTKKPDIDNIVKLVTDALNGIAYHDDNQVCEIRASKFYAIKDGIWIEIKQI